MQKYSTFIMLLISERRDHCSGAIVNSVIISGAMINVVDLIFTCLFLSGSKTY